MNIAWRLGKIGNVTLGRISTHFCLVSIKRSNYTLGFFVQCSGTNSLFLTLNKKYCRKCNKGWKSWHMHTLVSMHWIAIELVAIKMFYGHILKVHTFIEKWVLKLVRGSTRLSFIRSLFFLPIKYRVSQRLAPNLDLNFWLFWLSYQKRPGLQF